MLIPGIVLCLVVFGGQEQDLLDKSDGDISSLLSAPFVKADLKLSTEQKERIQVIRQKRAQEIIEFRRGLGKVDRENAGLVADAIKQIETQFDRQVLLELDAQQQVRLKQLFVQFRTRNKPFSFGLLNDKISQELKLTDAQRELIRKQSDSFAEKFSEKVKEFEADKGALIDAAKKLCFESLSLEQRTEYKRLFGEPFVFEEERNSPVPVR